MDTSINSDIDNIVTLLKLGNVLPPGNFMYDRYSIQIMNVFIRAMVRIFSRGERWNVPINEAKTFIICFI